MNKPARKLVEWARGSIRSLSVSPEFGSANAVYDELSSISGLSKSIIIKIHSGEAINPQVDTLDKLITAIKQIHLKIAA